MAVAPIFAQGTNQEYVNSMITQLGQLGGGGGNSGGGNNGGGNNAAVGNINLLGVRWTNPVGGTSPSLGDPATVSWSIVPDGTLVTSRAGGLSASNLIAFMDGIYGGGTGPVASRPWFELFSRVYDTWSQVSGIKFVYEPQDDGATYAAGSRGILGVRGDVRIGGNAIDGNNGILAFNAVPTGGGNTGTDGDMVIDTSDIWFRDNSDGPLGENRGLFNVMTHEAGHGLGLAHVIPVDETKLMEPFVSLAFSGPQHDDLIAIQTLYGDDYENNDGNTQASNLGVIENGTTHVRNLSIDRTEGSDVFLFTVSDAKIRRVSVVPQGFEYLVGPQGGAAALTNSRLYRNLSFQIERLNGEIVASANTAAVGITEFINNPGLSAGTYYLRVNATVGETQLYDLIFEADSTKSSGPILIGVQPNKSELIENGSIRNVAPRELTFRFDDKQVIDPETVGGIRVTRAGGDGSFGLPTNSSDFGTDGRVDIQLTSKIASEPLQVVVSRSDLGAGALPKLSATGSVVSIVLNSRANSLISAKDLVKLINDANSPLANKLSARINGGLQSALLGGDDPAKYSPIQLTVNNDLIIAPGSVIIGENPNENEVTLRFAESLPDDLYRLDIFGFDDPARGVKGLRNVNGDLFVPRDPNTRQDTIEFRLDLGAKITGVVPQPVSRNSAGQLQQARDTIVVYFDDEKLFIENDNSGKPVPGSVEDTRFYQLIETRNTVRNTDDNVILPIKATYNATANTVTLKFASDINALATGGSASTFRLRVGTSEAVPLPPKRMQVAESGATFSAAQDLGVIGSGTISQTSLLITADIDPELHPLDLAGSNTDPGSRRVPEPFENYINPNFTGDKVEGISTIYYNFQSNYGSVGGVAQSNAITEKQKARVREAFSLWSDRIGVQFIETPNSGLTMAVGTLSVLTGANVQRRDANFFGARIDPNYQTSLAVFSADNNWQDNYGEDFTRASAAVIGLLLGLANAGDADPSTLMRFDVDFINQGADRNFEPIFPGNLDVLRASYLHRPESSDIDLYRFDIDVGAAGAPRQGVLTAETLAERLSSSSTLDARLAVFKQTQASAVSNLGLGGGLSVEFTAVVPGSLGNNVQIFVTRSNRGTDPVTGLPAAPEVTTFPNAIVVDLNSTTGIESTVGDFVNAINNNPAASKLLIARVNSGDSATRLGNREISFSPIVLRGGSVDLVAQNDDYFGKDALLRLNLSSGRYYIGVSASGNDSYNASIPDTGDGGRTQGRYDLRLTFRAQTDGADTIRDVANQTLDQSVALDGDADGIPGGVYDFWFDTRPLDRVLQFTSGGSSDLEGRMITITGGNGVVRRFVFSSIPNNPSIGSGNTQILYSNTSSPSDLAAALSAAITFRSELQITAQANGASVTLRGERLVQLSAGLTNIELQGKTIFVDKSAGPNADGSLLKPFNNISAAGVPNAFAAALPGDIVRIVGNGGNDGRLETVADNFPYEIGFGLLAGSVLSDGQTMDVPKGVSVMVDAGAVLKLRRARIGVGSSTIGVDRSGGALQVLGTPKLLDAAGNVIRKSDGTVAGGNVFFTSWLDQQIGLDTYPPSTVPSPGDWGGILFKRDLDKSVGRVDLEDEGIFRQYINFAEMRYGGSSSVVIDSVQQTVNTVQITDMRPTITFNRITLAADSAISATPDSFEETLFSDPRYQRKGTFTPDYSRVGPKFHGNQLINNSVNGLFIKVSTPAGGALRQLTVAGRFDDTDIVHVIAENILVQGNPGGGLLDTFSVSSNLISLAAATGGNLAAGSYRYKVTFVDSSGYETPPSEPTAPITLGANQTAIRIVGLPGVSSGYASRRLYRNEGTNNDYRLVAELDGSSSEFIDRGFRLVDPVDPFATLLQDRPNVAGVAVASSAGGSLAAGGYTYRIVMIDASGREGLASAPTALATVAGANRTLQLSNLPRIQTGYSGFRIYRSAVGGAGAFSQIAEITDPAITSFTDNGTAPLGRSLSVERLGNVRPRLDASLVIDPGMVIKLEGARIELGHSTQLLAEGVDGSRIVMTSRQDDRFGAGGTFDTNNNGLNGSSNSKPGDWSGIYASPGANVSMDYVVLANAGGISRIEGTFKAFSPIEIQQGKARIANSTFEGNANGMGGQGPLDRLGRPANENYPFGNNASRGATLFVRGSQPILLDNTFQNNSGSAITIDINSMDAKLRGDKGRQTGTADRNTALDGNRGPLLRGNQFFNNTVNGLEIRADAASNNRAEADLSVRDLRRNVLTTDSVWDDADIVHVLFDSVVVGNLQSVGGLRLQSAVNESLVIKMEGQGSNFDHERGTGFTATGNYSSISDRVGGTIQVLGMPGFPVVFTSFRDDSVGAGTQPDGLPQTDTNNDGIATIPRPGDWRSLVFDSYSNDRNVRAAIESERPNVVAPGVNDSAVTAQFLGKLAPNPSKSDENLVLGWVVNGVISEPADQDIYSFIGTAGTEVWFDVDGTYDTLDSVLEILNANGDLLVRSDDSTAEQLNPSLIYRDPSVDAKLVGPVVQRTRDTARRHQSGLLKDDGTTNVRDAGLRLILPGVTGAESTYFFRIRSKGINIENTAAGMTSGPYAIQIRLRDQQEFPGSTVQFADIRYATNGVHALGLPYSSPLTGEANSAMLDADRGFFAEIPPPAFPERPIPLIDIGPLHVTNKGAISVAGQLLINPNTGLNEKQVYSFTIGDLASTYVGAPSLTARYPVIFDVDYADGLNRAALSLQVLYDNDNDPTTPSVPVTPTVRDRNFIVDDLPSPLNGSDLTDLTRGSVGTADPYLSFIGTAALQRGRYEVVVNDTNPALRRTGTYQLEIRMGDNILGPMPKFFRGSYSTSIEFLNGLTIPTGSKIDISDGFNRLTFEFTTTGNVALGNIPVPINSTDTVSVLAGKFRDAVNQVYQQNRLNVRAADRNRNVTGTSTTVIDLFGNVEVYDPSNIFTVAGVSGVLRFEGFGDQNVNRDQGQFIVANTIVSQARDYAVWAAPAEKYYASGRAQEPLYLNGIPNYVGAPTLGGGYARNLPVNNVVPFGASAAPAIAERAGVAPGMVVFNNIFDSAGLGGLHIQGDAPAWRITAFPGRRDLGTDSTVNPPDHSGTLLDDRDLLDVSFGRQSVRFEFEDLSGAPPRGPAFGSGVVGGNGWNPENIPIYYREDGGDEYLRAPGTSPGYSADEVVKAIRDAFIGSVLTTNGTSQRLSSWIEPQDDPIPGPGGLETWTFPTASIIVKGPQSISFTNVQGGGNPLSITPAGDFTAAPFVRAVNNTVIGRDGRASFNPVARDTVTNDTIAGAAETYQGISAGPQTYTVSGDLTVDPLSGGSSDVDMYKIQMEVGDRVRIDVDSKRGVTVDSALKMFDSRGIAQLVSTGSDPTTAENRSAPGEPSSLDPYVDFIATRAGVYYVAVSASGNTNYDPNSLAGRTRGNSFGEYTLSIQVLKPEQIVMVVDDPDSYADGETFTIQQVMDFEGGTSNSKTFEFTRNRNYQGANIPVFIGPEYRVPDVARSIANAITAANMTNAQSIPNGIFGTASPLAPVSAIALGGHNGFDPTYGVVGGGDLGINSGAARGPELQAGLNRYPGWTNDDQVLFFPIIPLLAPGTPDRGGGLASHASLGFGHDRTMSGPVNPLRDRIATAQGNGTSEKFVVVRNAYSIASSVVRRITAQPGTNNMNQLIPETGIMVSGGASPTLLNNTFVNVQSPIIQEEPSGVRPSAVVVGGNTYQYMEPAKPVTNLASPVEAVPTNVPNTANDFNFVATNSEKLFVDFPGGNFFPNSGSQIIDSSIDSLPEREGFRAVKSAVGIAPSPILAPDRDFYGLFRADDPNVAPPSGLGVNAFKDRGAIDKADFFGPSAIALRPVDNDAQRVDSDPTESVIELTSGIYPEFRIQLYDGFENVNLGGGSGIDDTSVVGAATDKRSAGASITITENNRLLVEGIDYAFSYNTTTNEIVLKPLAGVWRNDRVYDITINNKDRFVIQAVSGEKVNDGDSFAIRDSNGANVNFEFDSGFRLQLPIGLQLNLPLAGGGAGGVVDGDRFFIQSGGLRREFEFDSNGNTVVQRPDGIISFNSLTSKSQIADKLVVAINNSFTSGVVAKKLDSNDVFIAAPQGAAIEAVDAPSLSQPAQTLGVQVPVQGTGLGGINDGQTFSVTDGRRAVVFEFDTDNVANVQSGNVRVDISNANTIPAVAQAIQSAIQASGLLVKSSVIGNDIVHIGLPGNGRVDLLNTKLNVVGVSRKVLDGETITITRNNGTVSKTYEFDSNGSWNSQNTRVQISTTDTQAEIGEKLAAAIGNSAIGLSPKHFGNGNVVIGGVVGDAVSVANAPTVDIFGNPGVLGNTTLQVFGTLLMSVPSRGGLDLVDDSTFTISNNGTTVTFEFDSNFSGASSLGNEVIRFNGASSQNDVVASILQAINSTTRLGLIAIAAGQGRINLGLLSNSAVNVLDSGLKLERGLAQDGDHFSISNGTTTVTFEFENLSVGNGRVPSRVPIRYTNQDTVQRLYEAMQAALKSSILNLDSEITPQGLKLKDTADYIVNTDNAPSLVKLGVPGGSIAIPFIQDPKFTPQQMRESIIRAINQSRINGNSSLVAKVRGDSTLFVENAVTIGPEIPNYFLRGVQDVAGNFLKSNRINNETQFTILMPGVTLDYGDAPDPAITTTGRYPTLKNNDGARHVVSNSDLRLGLAISTEKEGKPAAFADSDDGDDGVTFRFQRSDFGSTGTPIFNKNVDTEVTVTLSRPGALNGWIDFNFDGDWSDPGEHVLDNVSFDQSLTQTFLVRIPSTAPTITVPTTSFARFRVSSVGDIQSTGLALDGEVEDYRISFVPGIPPLGVDDAYTLIEDQIGGFSATDPLGNLTPSNPSDNGVLANDSNPQNKVLSAVLVSPPQNAQLFNLRPDGTFDYRPLPNFFGVDTFQYSVNDGVLDGLRVVTVTLTVQEQNDPPTAGDLSLTTDEDVPLQITKQTILTVASAGPANESNQELTISVVPTSAQGGKVAVVNGVITYTPAQDFQGLDSFAYTVTDNGTTAGASDPKSATGTIFVTVLDLNDPPITTPKFRSTNEDQSVEISTADLIAGDKPGPANESSQGLAFTGVIPTSTQGGSVVVVGSKVVYTPPLNFNGEDTFFYIVTDDGKSGSNPDPKSSRGTVTVTVSAVNDSPAVVKPFGTENMVEDDPAKKLTLSDYFTDPDIATNGDVLSYRIVSNTNPSLVEPTFQNGQLVLLPKPDQNGTAVIVVEAKDLAGLTVTNTLTLQVAAVSDAPRLVSPLPDRTVAEDSGTILITLTPDYFFDPDVINGDKLTFAVSSSNTKVATVEVVGNVLQVSLVQDAFGQSTISVTATDTTGQSVSDSFLLTVTPVNDNPVAVADSYAWPQGEVFTTTDPSGTLTATTNDNGVLANDSDVDKDLITAELRSQPTRGSVVLNPNGTFTYTPGSTALAGTSDVFRYRAKDPTGGVSSEVTVTITFGPPLPARFQNPSNRYDVNADGFVSPIDVLIVINLINSKGPGWNGSIVGLPGPPDYVDVNGNNVIEALDALNVIDFINSRGSSGGGGGEGEGNSLSASSSKSGAMMWTYEVGRSPSANAGNSVRSASESRAFTSVLANAAQPAAMPVRESTNLSLAQYLASVGDVEDMMDLDLVAKTQGKNRKMVDEAFANLFGE